MTTSLTDQVRSSLNDLGATKDEGAETIRSMGITGKSGLHVIAAYLAKRIQQLEGMEILMADNSVLELRNSIPTTGGPMYVGHIFVELPRAVFDLLWDLDMSRYPDVADPLRLGCP